MKIDLSSKFLNLIKTYYKKNSSKFIILEFERNKTYEDHVGSLLQNLT
jgi:hypothetical protein